MALASQRKALAAQPSGLFEAEIVPVTIAEEGRPDRRREGRASARDEPRSTREAQGRGAADGSVTAGNASGVNDGACALLLADEATAARHGLVPRVRVVAMATAGVPPASWALGRHRDAQGAGPGRAGARPDGRYRAQRSVRCAGAGGVARSRCCRRRPAVNPNGGAIALGHPLAHRVRASRPPRSTSCTCGGRYALCTMCIGVGQGSRSFWSASDVGGIHLDARADHDGADDA